MEERDIEQLINVFKGFKFLIIIVTVLGMIAGYVYNDKMTKPMYEASTTIITAMNNSSDEENSSDTLQEVSVNNQLEATYSDFISSSNFLNQVKENLGLNSISELGTVSMEKTKSSAIIRIVVKNADSAMAQKIAAEAGNVFVSKINELYNIKNVKVLDQAQLPENAYNIKPVKYAVVGACIGFIISCVGVCTLAMMNSNIIDEKEIENKLGVPVLARFNKDKSKENRLPVLNVNSIFSEKFRVLASNINFLKAKVILVTSNMSGEGKSWITSNLAITYAKSGKKTLIIDADMRCGVQDKVFEIEGDNVGLSNFIENEAEITKKRLDYCKYNVMNNLDVITKGNAALDFSLLLFSKAVEKAINILKDEYDYIIIDGTPNAIVADDLVYVKNADTTVVVVKYGKTSIADLTKMKQSIERSGGNVSGAVFNQIPTAEKINGEGYYKYAYASSNVKETNTAKVNRVIAFFKNKIESFKKNHQKRKEIRKQKIDEIKAILKRKEEL